MRHRVPSKVPTALKKSACRAVDSSNFARLFLRSTKGNDVSKTSADLAAVSVSSIEVVTVRAVNFWQKKRRLTAPFRC